MSLERLRRWTLTYVAMYLAVGGAGLLLAPAFALSLLFATGTYDDVMPRVVGMFMVVLSGLVASFVRRGDYAYYGMTVAARAFIVMTLTILYFRSADRLFLVLDGIVLIGLVPSAYAHLSVVRRTQAP